MSQYTTPNHVSIDTVDRNIEMASCPFCGSKAIMLYLGRKKHLTCIRCGSDGPMADDPFQAITLWNKRSS